MRPSGEDRGGGEPGQWPGPAGAPRSDSLVLPSCSETASCRCTAARGSHGLRRGNRILLFGEEKKFGKFNKTVLVEAEHAVYTVYNPQGCLMVFCVPSVTNK